MSGWISVQGTDISYPVLISSDDYYLHRNMEGQKDYHGCIYSRDSICGSESDDTDVSCVTLYGHNMRDGSMFAGLHRIESDDIGDRKAYLYVEDGWRIYTLSDIKNENAQKLSEELYSGIISDGDVLVLITCSRNNRRLVTEWIAE